MHDRFDSVPKEVWALGQARDRRVRDTSWNAAILNGVSPSLDKNVDVVPFIPKRDPKYVGVIRSNCSMWRCLPPDKVPRVGLLVPHVLVSNTIG